MLLLPGWYWYYTILANIDTPRLLPRHATHCHYGHDNNIAASSLLATLIRLPLAFAITIAACRYAGWCHTIGHYADGHYATPRYVIERFHYGAIADWLITPLRHASHYIAGDWCFSVIACHCLHDTPPDAITLIESLMMPPLLVITITPFSLAAAITHYAFFIANITLSLLIHCYHISQLLHIAIDIDYLLLAFHYAFLHRYVIFFVIDIFVIIFIVILPLVLILHAHWYWLHIAIILIR